MFVYGSLLDPKSFSQTIVDRCVDICDYTPAVLRHYRKCWGVPVRRINMVSATNWRPLLEKTWASLTIRYDSADLTAVAYGAVIGVTEDELSKLAERELSYLKRKVKVEEVKISQFPRLLRLRVLCRDLVNPGWRSLAKYKEVYAFYPRKEPEFEGDDLPDQWVVRRGYVRRTKAGHRRVIIPDDIPTPYPHLEDAYDADKEFVSKWREYYEKVEGFGQLHHDLLDSLKECKVFRNDGGASFDEEKPIRTLVRPFVVSAHLHALLGRLAEDALVAASHALDYMLSQDSVSDHCCLSAEDMSLAKAEEQEGGRLPQIARVDFIVTRDEIKILELNTDSPAGMAHVDVIGDWLRERLSEDAQRFWPLLVYPKKDVLKSALCEAFCKRWRDFSQQSRELRSLAIVDSVIRDQPALSEFEIIRAFLAEHLLGRKDADEFVICEPSSLKYRNGKLCFAPSTTQQNPIPIDLIYKRILWQDLRGADETAVDMKRAYMEHKVCIVNSLRSRLLGDKLLIALLWESQQTDLKGNERVESIRAYLPETHVFKDAPDLLNQVLSHPYDWVVKSFMGYGSRGVIIYRDMDLKEWKEKVRKAYQSRTSIAQRRYPHGKIFAPIFTDGRVQFRNMPFIVGAYVVDGKCLALEAKAAPAPPISMNPPHRGYRTVVLSTG